MAERMQETPFVGPYLLQNVLGKGQTGVVKLGVHTVSKKKVAIKIIDRTKLAPHILQKVEREIAIMKLINHPNILGLYDVYENKKNLYLVLEYVGGGELFEYLVKRKRLQSGEARRFYRQIVSAVDFCHQHLICHRDLKPENLLLDNKKNVKIADFGMASVQPFNSMLETSCGSPHYAAPEVVRGDKYDGRKADVWSCGVILYALVVGCLPFDDDNLRHLLEKVKKGVFVIPGFVPNDCRDLLEKMIKVDPDERPTMSQVRMHRFLKSDDLPPEPPVQRVVQTEVIDDERDLDPDILNSMTSLGCFKDKEDLIQRLLSPDESLERVIYFLLMDRKNKVSYQEEEEELSVYSMQRLEADPPRKRGESRIFNDESPAIPNLKDGIRKPRAMTYHGDNLDKRRGSASNPHDSNSKRRGSASNVIDFNASHTVLTPPGSPWRSRLTAFKKTVGAGIFVRRRSQSCSDDAANLESNGFSASTPDISTKRSWFTNFLFHTPGQIQPFLLQITNQSTEDIKRQMEKAFSALPHLTHFTVSPLEYHIVYKKSKGLYHRKTLINLRYEISSYSKCTDGENFPILIHITFINGSHRKFRKLCMYIQNHLNATTDRNDGNFDNNRNGMLPDGLLQPNRNESVRENGKESGKETGRKTSLAGRSTENLLDSDESIDC
ncbi:serine/threonine-protein kinase BRSK2-like [Rhopilema esculentum]|uniref:serine/threonine-protein kinase BRSK2-like n=1 Tax=Rhopilema esculentum TaxID=499914 RepID=UPI0031DE4133